MMFVRYSSPHHAPIKYRCPIEKSDRITPAHLQGSHSSILETFTRAFAPLNASDKFYSAQYPGRPIPFGES
jgi:hypothetical protein